MGFSQSCTKSKNKSTNPDLIKSSKQQKEQSKNPIQQDIKLSEKQQPKEVKQQIQKQQEDGVVTAPHTQTTYRAQEDNQQENKQKNVKLEEIQNKIENIEIDEEVFKKENSDGYLTKEQYQKVLQYLQVEKEELKGILEIEKFKFK